MPVARREKEKQPFHFHAAAMREKCRQTARAQARQPFEKLVDLMKAFARRQLVEEFEECALGCREDQRPIPLSPRLRDKALARICATHCLALGKVPALTAAGIGNRVGGEQGAAVMKDEPDIER